MSWITVVISLLVSSCFVCVPSTVSSMSNADKAFAVVEFDTCELAVVPKTWIIGCQDENKCTVAYPKLCSEKRVAALAKSQCLFKSSWPRYAVKIVVRNDKYDSCQHDISSILEDSDSEMQNDSNEQNANSEMCLEQGETTSHNVISKTNFNQCENVSNVATKKAEFPENTNLINVGLDALNVEDYLQRHLHDESVAEFCLMPPDDDDDDYIPDSQSEHSDDDMFVNHSNRGYIGGVLEHQNLLPVPEDVNDENSVDLSNLHSGTSVQVPVENDSQRIPAASVKTNRKLAKIKRPCPFCSIMQARLTRHITKRHKDLEEVQSILKLPDKQRHEQFDLLKKRGIFEHNKIRIAKNEPIQVERRNAEKDVNQRRIKFCAKCKGFIDATWFFRHKKECGKICEDNIKPDAIPLDMIETQGSFDKGSFDDLLSRFRRDAIGTLCRKDNVILQLGRHLFRKIEKRRGKELETRRTVMQNMRLLGVISSRFREICAEKQKKQVETSDMFLRENFNLLEKAIRDTSTAKDGSVKNATRVFMANTIKRTSKVLRGHYLIQCNDAKAKEVENFEAVFKLHYTALFGSAEAAILQNRNENLRDPNKLPMENDVSRVRTYTLKIIKDLLETPRDGWEIELYLKLRNAVVSRLTFYNARRGGEPCRILLDEWHKGNSDKYIDSNRTAHLTEQEKQLVECQKVIYQAGKGNKLVPVIVTNDLIEAINILANDTIRRLCGINADNKFLFPSKSGSLNHVSGYYANSQLARDAGISGITATGMRHRAATMHASLGKSATENREFYQHMGHESEVNEAVYQCPPAVRELIHVGPYLQSIDSGANQEANEKDSNETEDNGSDTEVIPNEMNRTELPHTEKENQVLGDPQTNAHSDDESVCYEPPKKRSRKQYCRWPRAVETHLREFFKDCIEDVSVRGNRGSLPSNEEKRRFLQHHPGFLSNETASERLKIVHAKLFNERSKIRKKYFGRMQALAE